MTRRVMAPSPARPGRLLAVNVTACVLLLFQYLLGMVVNVYVVLPGRHPGAGAGNYFTGAASGLAWVRRALSAASIDKMSLSRPGGTSLRHLDGGASCARWSASAGSLPVRSS